MTTGRFTPRLEYLGACALVAVACTWPLAASAHDDHVAAAQHHESIAKHNNQQTSDFVKRVREATRRFQDPDQALREGYLPQFGCVSGSHEGAMGVHFVNDELVKNPALVETQPELLVYEPMSHGRLRLVAADYLVPKALWHANGPAPPQLAGQLFHLFEFPNRFGLPEFYTLHVWAWKPNPQGTFANWNPNVSCDAFEGDHP